LSRVAFSPLRCVLSSSSCLPPRSFCSLFPYTTLFRSFLFLLSVLIPLLLLSSAVFAAVFLRRFFHRLLAPVHPRQADGHGKIGEGRESTRLNSSHVSSSYAVFFVKKEIGQPTNDAVA